MTGVVLDTNVLVSANLNDEGLEALVVSFALTGLLQLYLSEPILQEYEQVLRYPHLNFLPAEVHALMNRVRGAGIVVTPRHRLHEAKHAPDNRFLECAEAAKAEYLVTGNKRHFPSHWKRTKIVNARELLSMLVE